MTFKQEKLSVIENPLGFEVSASHRNFEDDHNYAFRFLFPLKAVFVVSFVTFVLPVKVPICPLLRLFRTKIAQTSCGEKLSHFVKSVNISTFEKPLYQGLQQEGSAAFPEIVKWKFGKFFLMGFITPKSLIN
uniref:Uncharacterized protein n=1 Tax=Glossina pallidipes TaxID=7398 RepID=A0A1A9ZPP1_GLOPL